MRYLILSDIHANWEGLQAVLEDAGSDYDEILCCGDLVGYGADPNACTDWVRANVKKVIRGNHDKACTGSEDLEWFNPVAKASVLWTQKTLTPDNHEYLRSLAKGPVGVGEFQILHGSPVDEDEYLITVADAEQMVGYLQSVVGFFGHTHVQGGFIFRRNGTQQIPPVPEEADQMEIHLEPDQFYLINPGSVGQPRDADPRVAYLFYVPEDRYVLYRRVAYDLAGAQAKILAAGLPDALARRLAIGQ